MQNKVHGRARKKDISDNLKKLLDHVSLDIARIRFYTGEDENIVGMDTIGNIEKLLNETNERVRITERKSEESTKKLEESTKKLEKVQQESIAILSIFAAVSYYSQPIKNRRIVTTLGNA